MNSECSGCQRKNNIFAFHSDAEIKDQEKKRCPIPHHREESGKQGAPGLQLLSPSGNRAWGQQDQWPLLMHVLAAKWPSQPLQLGPGSLRAGGSGACVHLALAPETALGKCQTGL